MLKMHRTILYVLVGSSLENAKSFALLFSLYSPFCAHDTTCLLWTRLKMLQGIPHGFSTVSHRFLKFFKTFVGEEGRRGLVSCLRPHLSTRLCNSSVCVSMLCFETVMACVSSLC